MVFLSIGRPTGWLGTIPSRASTASVSAPGYAGRHSGLVGHAAGEPGRGRREQRAAARCRTCRARCCAPRPPPRRTTAPACTQASLVANTLAQWSRSCDGEFLGEHRAQFGPAGDVVLTGQVSGVRGRASPAARRRTAARSRRPRRSGRRRTRRCRSTGAPVSSMLVPRTSLHMPHVAEGPHHGGQHAGAVDHCGVHHLALAGASPAPTARTGCRRAGTSSRRRSRRPGSAAGRGARLTRPTACSTPLSEM